jgi:hypothetical protein
MSPPFAFPIPAIQGFFVSVFKIEADGFSGSQTSIAAVEPNFTSAAGGMPNFPRMNFSTSGWISSPFTIEAFFMIKDPLGSSLPASKNMYHGEPQLRVSPTDLRTS